MIRFEMLTGHATVLLVENVLRAMDYYRDRLGFAVTIYEADPGLYASAERDDCHVHFAHYDGASAKPNHELVPPDMFDAYFWPDDVDSLHQELADRGATIIRNPNGSALRPARVPRPGSRRVHPGIWQAGQLTLSPAHGTHGSFRR